MTRSAAATSDEHTLHAALELSQDQLALGDPVSGPGQPEPASDQGR